jgi:hypothetical protein
LPIWAINWSKSIKERNETSIVSQKRNKMKTKENNTKENNNTSPKNTKNDLDALPKKGLSMDTGDDRLLQTRKEEIDFTGKDLDIPSGEGSNVAPSSGITDEENTLFGQGGERKENLETPERANSKTS